MRTFHLPDVGEGLHEAELVAWLVGVGDHVVADQPLVSIETDKAVVEIPSPRSGHIAALHGEPGDVIEVGAALVDFADGERADAGAIVGELPSNPAASPDGSPAPRPSAPPTAAGARAVRAAPAVRSLASDLGVALDRIAGTGPGGTVTRADVRAAADRHPTEGGGASIEPLRGVRRAMDANMARAGGEVVPATVTDDADISDWPLDTDTSVRLVRALARACVSEPALNAVYLGRDVGRRLDGPVDIGIAVDTEDGLFVPVIRDAANRTPRDLRHGLDALRADVEARTIPPEHLTGATISLSNFGVFGGRHAALVVVPPQVAIVGAGRAHDAAVAREGRVVVRRLLPLSLTFDHRVVTGSEATRFLDALRTDLETAR